MNDTIEKIVKLLLDLPESDQILVLKLAELLNKKK